MKTIVQTAAHGVSGGVISSIDGGEFGSGFAAGAVSSLISGTVQGLGVKEGILNAFGESDWYNAATIAAGGLSGGLSSTIAGGNFWMGARQGLIVSGLNHVGHNAYKNIQENKLQRQLRKYSHLDVLLGDEWGRERAFQILVDNVPILRKEFLKSTKIGGKITINMEGGVNEGNPNTIASTSGDPGWAKITFFDLSFKDVYTFGVTIHHELIHAYHHVSGMYQRWLKQAGNGMNALFYANRMSEHYAYAETYRVTGEFQWYHLIENNLIDAKYFCPSCF